MSIRDIPISREKKAVPVKPVVNYHEKYDIPKVRGNRRPINPKFVIWLIAIVALLALFFGVSLIFSRATLTIAPKVETVTFNGDTYSLPFEVLKLNKEDGMTVEATEEKEANQKASGKIVIYNNYSSASQRLINNTRFETADGKIYRLNSSVDVPGTKVVAGKTIPGSVEATVFADQPGDSYNLRLSDLKGDFKIPGFKGSPRYNSFYALLKTDIAGGLVGKQRVVADTVRTTAIEAAKAALKENLTKELYAVKPDNYLVFPNSYTITFSNLPDSIVSDSKVKISVRGELNSVVFNSLKLADLVAAKKITNFDNLAVNFISGEDLKTTFVAKDQTNLWKNTAIDLKLTGQAKIKWLYDTEEIKRELAGRKASDAVSILSKYKEQVKSIVVAFSPVWTRYFPDDLGKIKVVELD